jgi:sulfur carrier protein
MANPTTQTIEIVLNGEPRAVPEGLSVRQLLEVLEIAPDRVAVEMHREIVRQREWDSAIVMAGAHLEIVMFVGGG